MPGAGTTGSSGGLININSASATELETLSGIGEVLAAVVEYREQNGPFASVDDLMDVSGIGPATLEDPRPGLGLRAAVGAWMLPTAASAFALGLLGSGSTPDWLASWMALVVGLVLLIAGWFAAGREPRSRRAGASGSSRPEREVVEAVGGRGVPSVTPVLVASISLLGVLTLGAGWGAFHDRALDGALLADLAPERVVLTGTFKTDPKESTLGWSAVAQVRRVEWPEGAATPAPRSGSAGATRCLGLAEETASDWKGRFASPTTRASRRRSATRASRRSSSSRP